MKPIIGVLPLWDDDRNSMWMLPGYFDGISEAGGIPVMLPLKADECETEQLCRLADGFLFTGGHDVDSRMYNEEIRDGTVICAERDELEKRVFSAALRNGKPVLGICRGIQIINVLLGGTLYQDIPTQFKSDTEHHMSAPYDREIHRVNIVRNSPLGELLKKDSIGVNSYHHQAVRDVAPELSVMAYSEDGLAEAVYMKNQKFVWAFQWHPEFSFRNDENSRMIFRKFTDSCKDN